MPYESKSLLSSNHAFDGLDGEPHSSPAGRPSIELDGRHFDRISVTGRALLDQHAHAPLDARLHDMSTSGFSLYLDFQLRLSQMYHLKLSVFRHGRTYALDVQARCVYALLVRDNGFKHGFEFRGLNDAAEDTLRAILADD